jgi:hypothetical protein
VMAVKVSYASHTATALGYYVGIAFMKVWLLRYRHSLAFMT